MIQKDLQGFIPAAGLGSRLRPLTDNRPKALVEVHGTTLLERSINRLTDLGIRHIVVNVHHFSNQIIDFISTHRWNAEILISNESDQLMDTGGAIKQASPLFLPDLPILIHNVDVLSTVNLTDAFLYHTGSQNDATLLVSQRDTNRQLLFDRSNKLIGWHDHRDDSYLWSHEATTHFNEFAFSGISIINPSLIDSLPPVSPYPIIPQYIKLSKDHRISYFKHEKEDWIDVGKMDILTQLNENNTYEKFFA